MASRSSALEVPSRASILLSILRTAFRRGEFLALPLPAAATTPLDFASARRRRNIRPAIGRFLRQLFHAWRNRPSYGNSSGPGDQAGRTRVRNRPRLAFSGASRSDVEQVGYHLDANALDVSNHGPGALTCAAREARLLRQQVHL